MTTPTACVYDDRMPMPAKTTPRLRPGDEETWSDWRPWESIDPERLMTRQELVDQAREAGIAVTAQDIANWQRDGILPRGIPRRSGRVLEALYPPWYVNLLRDVRAKQAEGWRLADIGPLLRLNYARQHVVSATGRIVTEVYASERPLATTRRVDPALVATDDLAHTLRAIAREHEETYGGHIARVELRLIDDHGNPLTIAVETP